MPEVIGAWVTEFGKQASSASIFLSSSKEIEEYPELLPYAHYLRQAWTVLNLAAVLCVDGRPTVYLCESKKFTAERKREIQRFVWNQSLVPLLVLETSNAVEVHSTVKFPEPPNEDQDLFEAQFSSLVLRLGHIAEALELANFVRSIETGQFFQDHANFFPSDQTVDCSLLRNLILAARRLTETGWTLSQAHALLGRTLFVSFLHERDFITSEYFPAGATQFIDILNESRVDDIKRLLYREFFPRLKREFNGTMFDTALAEEERHIGRAQLSILSDFLSRQDMQSGQMALGFWAYDFRYIPVEIISAIYEEFMKDADLKKKRKEGAYYTPRHLAETALHIALENRYSESQTWRVLDPACGSGIFLVAMFNLLSEQWLRANAGTRKQTKAQAMLNILNQQIRGVDSNPDACRIAAFSLYLALFEKLKPMDVREFKEKVNQGPFLPALLRDGRTHDELVPVITHGDFLKDNLSIERNFDLVIGNPPWESRGKEQVALHFTARSLEFLKPSGIGCLLLPSPILVNRHGSLDLEWFRTVTVEKIVQLADFRFVLFKATHPCFIMRFVKQSPSFDHLICYETPKLSRFDRRRGIINVEPQDQKLILEADVLSETNNNPLQAIWNRKFWGTPRDESFLQRLDFYPKLRDLVGTRAKAKRWLSGTGLQPHYEERNYKGYNAVSNPFDLDDAFLDAKSEGIYLVLFKDQFTTLGRMLQSRGASREKLLFARSKRNFAAPMVVYSKGFTKFAFSAHPVKFFDGLRSITGPKADGDLLRFLAAVLSSRLAKYIAFHAGSNFGVGRDQFHVYESLALPFFLPDHDLAPSNADEILEKCANIVRGVEATGSRLGLSEREALVHESVAKLEPLIEAYYAVSDAEKFLIEDTLAISQPSIHHSNVDTNIPSLQFPDETARRRYAEVLCDTLNRRARRNGIHVRAEGQVSKSLSLILLTVIFGTTSKPYSEKSGDTDVWRSLERINTAAKHSNRSFNYLRGFSYFAGDRLYSVKPATMRNWSRTAALNDADAIFEYLAERRA
jgi:hypothetical protein